MAARQRSRSASPAVPRSAASMWSASAAVRLATAARSRSPAGGVAISSTATVPAADAIHQPARRSGIMPTVPGEAAGST